jgi:hypothetical protein
MKWWLTTFAAVLVAAFVGAAVLYSSVKSHIDTYSYTYRYRLQLGLSVDEKIYTGSSVIEVSWRCVGTSENDYRQLGPCYPTVRGQAAVIDLGPGGVLVVALYNGETVLPTPDPAIDAVWLCANAFGNPSTWNNAMPALRNLAGWRSLSADNFPRLIWFSNAADPRSARKVPLQDIPTTFTEAFVEITDEPIVVDIANKLPWFPELRRLQKSGGGPLSKPGEFQLIHIMFAGETS